MDPESRQAARLLETLWAIHQRLWELALRLGSAPEVASARSASGFRRYSERTPPERRVPWIEYHLWAELGDEKGIAAWLGVHWDEEGWRVRCYAKVEHGGGRETFVLSLPEEEDGDEEERTINGFVATLESAAARLIGTIDSLDLAEV